MPPRHEILMYEVDRKTRLFNILHAFSVAELQKFIQLCFWLDHNGFTLDDLSDNLDFIRKVRSGMYVSPYEETTDPTEMPYMRLKSFYKMLRKVQKGILSVDDIRRAYINARKINLSFTTSRLFDRKNCRQCGKGKMPEDVREVLR